MKHLQSNGSQQVHLGPLVHSRALCGTPEKYHKMVNKKNECIVSTLRVYSHFNIGTLFFSAAYYYCLIISL